MYGRRPALHAGSDVDPVRNRRLALVASLVAAVAALPLLAGAPLALHDWPNHLARVDIIDQMLRGDAFWGAFYELPSLMVPNAALDVFILGLLRAGLSLQVAGSLFLLLIYAVFVTGFVRMSAAFDAGGAVKPLFGAILFYNIALFWGFVNYTVALGAMFWALSFWMRADRVGIRLLVATLGSAIVFGLHPYPAFLFVGVLGLLDIYSLARSGGFLRRQQLQHCTSLAGAVVVLVLLSSSPAGSEDMQTLQYYSLGTVGSFLLLKSKLFLKALFSGDTRTDIALFVGVVLLAGLTLWAARIRLAVAPLIIVVALFLLTIAAPAVVGISAMIDARLGIVPVMFFAAAVRLYWRGSAGQTVVVAAAAALVLVRTATLTLAWHNAGQVYADADAAFAKLPRGSVLLTVDGTRHSEVTWEEWWNPAMSHIATLAARHGLFVPSVFANPTQQPLIMREQFRQWAQPLKADAPGKYAEILDDARALCASDEYGVAFKRVFLAVLYPRSLPPSPALQLVTTNLALIDPCAAPPS